LSLDVHPDCVKVQFWKARHIYSIAAVVMISTKK